MSLKGKFPFAQGNLVVENAYAVIDFIHIEKGGNASAHISVYARPPIDSIVTQQRLNVEKQITEDVTVEVRDRGPVVEHYTCAGFKITDASAFVTCYENLPTLDERFKDMVSA